MMCYFLLKRLRVTLKVGQNRILKIDPDFQVPHARAIVNTRNRVIHGYDSVTPDFLWTLIMKHIPVLKGGMIGLLEK
ncbi:HepT-like ribonuclease domain-containing protein [Parabacteroides sp.]